LQVLRDLGYRTFDHVLDNSYDRVLDNTQRYIQLRAELDRINTLDLHVLYQQCRDDLIHNQELLLSCKQDRLSCLDKQLQKFFVN